MFARHSRRAVVINYLLAAGPVAQDDVGVAGAATHLVLTKFNHADFRVEGTRVVDGLRNLLFVSQDKYFSRLFSVMSNCELF